MPFSKIRYSSFRNLADAELDLAAERILLGKTVKAKPIFWKPSTIFHMAFPFGDRSMQRP